VDRATRNLFVLVFVVVILVTGAAALLLGGTSRIDPGAPADATSVDGVIVAVRSEGLDKVSGFDLRTTDQGTLQFTLGDLENGAQFPPGHLVEHQATALPVRVWYRSEGGDRVAVRLEDAPNQ
jgi:hypothetical protein